MKKFGYFRASCAVPNISVANTKANALEIIALCKEAYEESVGVVLFPELSITGYTCGDLFHQSMLLDGVEKAIDDIVKWSKGKLMMIVVGAPVLCEGALYNCGVAICDGEILGAVPKAFLPNGQEFYEKRWFQAGFGVKNKWATMGEHQFPLGMDLLFCHKSWPELVVGIELCEDVWATIPPSCHQALAGATLILNPSASNAIVGKREKRRDIIRQQSSRTNTAYLYCSTGSGESTTDVVFDGDAMIVENGTLIKTGVNDHWKNLLLVSDLDIEAITRNRWIHTSFKDSVLAGKEQEWRRIQFETQDAQDCDRKISPTPFTSSNLEEQRKRYEEMFRIQTIGLVSRLKHLSDAPMVIGISGGLDSTLALMVCVNACDYMGLDRKMVHAVTMPGFGTTDRTYENAVQLIKNLGVTFHEISIKEACTQHLLDIGHNMEDHDTTYENAQARERTQILMDLGNKVGGIVVGTGDMSELALGWATYNGDHMSMYGVNGGIPKTLVRGLVEYIADLEKYQLVQGILRDVVDTPVSPELLPPDQSGKIAQKTEDLVGPYELHDFFLFYMLRYGFGPAKILYLAQKAFEGDYSNGTILKWLKKFYWRFFSQQYKRSCLPDGPKVGTIGISPRGDWRMPSDAKVNLWIEILDEM